jgi:hypothetical protein
VRVFLITPAQVGVSCRFTTTGSDTIHQIEGQIEFVSGITAGSVPVIGDITVTSLSTLKLECQASDFGDSDGANAFGGFVVTQVETVH